MALKRDDIVIRFGGDASKFQKVAKSVKATANDIKGRFGEVGNAIGAFFSRTLAGAVTGVGAAFSYLAKSALSTADAIAKTADRVGVSIEGLQRLRYAAKATGVEERTLEMALQRFARRTGEAAQGTGELVKEFERLRIPLRDANGNMRTTEEILLDYADAVQAAESDQEKLRLSFKAFDSEGAALVNTLRNGSEGMRDLMERADELGLVIDENTVRASERLNQAWEDFTTRVSVGFKKAVLEVVGAMDRLAGNYRTVESLEAALEEKRGELDEQRKKRDESFTKFGEVYHQNRMGNIAQEIAQLEQQLDTMQALEKMQKSLIDTTASAQSQAAATSAKTRSKSSAEPEDWRDKTPEEIAAALNDFRAGRITGVELGERAGLQPPGTAKATPYGAYGTESNTASGAIADGGAVTVGSDLENLNQQLMDWFVTHEYVIKVRPELVGLEGIEAAARPAAYQAGGRE
ncbi:MAG: hypothetical protein WBN07_05280 [Woeseiaceae bacterium]